MERRINWLWRLVALYLASIEAIGHLLTEEIGALLSAERSPSGEKLDAVRRKHLGLQVLLQESSPMNICGTSFEHRVYGGMWSAWQGDRLMSKVEGEL